MPINLDTLVGALAIAGSVSCIAFFGTRIFLTQYDSYEQLALRRINEELDQVYIFMDPVKFLHLSMLLAGLAFLFGFALAQGDLVAGLVQGIALALVAFVVPRLIIRARIRRRLLALNEQLPEALDMLASSMRANLTLLQALERSIERVRNPIAQEFGVIRQECRLGSGIAAAINHWALRNDLVDLKIVAAATEVSIRLGGNLADTYEGLAQLIRDRLMFEREVGAITAEGRMQGIVMAVLPFIILVIMTFINRSMMVPFITSKVGLLLIALVFVMQVTAYLWIRKIVDVEY